ncbi:MAG: hypothetical protein JNL32_07510 [Candidatus Kapabacteria bacterium]|nr:hypothetical protein [Candidatus Kapabacteria bacterium]
MEQIQSYFNAERYESILFVGIGLISIAVSVWMYRQSPSPFSIGMMIPFIGIALIGMTVGTTVFLRSPKDIQRVESIMQSNPSAIQTEEIPRMETVMKSFVLYRWIEISFIVVGLCLMFILKDFPFWNGVGVGLFIQAALMLSFDYFAERRGIEYLRWLQQL